VIGSPINDHDCLGAATAWVRQSLPALAHAAAGYASTRALAEQLRRRPQLNDYGQIPPGVPTIACDVTQRARLDPPDPNCYERALTYLGLAEWLDAGPLRQLATLSTPAGRHTVVFEEGTLVVLDPYTAGAKSQSPSRNMPHSGAAHVFLGAAPATEAQVLAGWLLGLAEQTAAYSPAPFVLEALARTRYLFERFGLVAGRAVSVCTEDCALELEELREGRSAAAQQAQTDLLTTLSVAAAGAHALGPEALATVQTSIALLLALGFLPSQRNQSFDPYAPPRRSTIVELSSTPRRRPAMELLDPYPATPPARPAMELLDPYPATPAKKKPAPSFPPLPEWELRDPYPEAPRPRTPPPTPAPAPSPAPMTITLDDLAELATSEEERREREADMWFLRALDWSKQRREEQQHAARARPSSLRRNCGCSPSAIRNVDGQDVFEVFHQIGKGVLGVFGAGALGDQVGVLWQEAGLRKKPPPTKPQAPQQAQKRPATADTETQKHGNTDAKGSPKPSTPRQGAGDDPTIERLLSAPNVCRLVAETGVKLDGELLAELLARPEIAAHVTTGGKLDVAKVDALLGNPFVARMVAAQLKQRAATQPAPQPSAQPSAAGASGLGGVTLDSLGGT
jgi:hypothetical protein